jgi:hypothetical protein
VLLNNAYIHLPRRSSWSVSSPTSWNIGLGTPWLRFGADRTNITVPLTRRIGVTVTETAVLSGRGLGLDLGINIAMPFLSYAWSTSVDPGFGSPIYESMFCPEPLEARHFAGLCIVASANAVLQRKTVAGRSASAAVVIFADRLSFGSLLPTSINAVAVVGGLGRQLIDFASIGAEVAVYEIDLEPVPQVSSNAP